MSVMRKPVDITITSAAWLGAVGGADAGRG